MNHDSLRVSKAANMTFLRSGPDTFFNYTESTRRTPLAIQSVFGLCPAALCVSLLLSRLSEDNVEQGRSRHRFNECCSPNSHTKAIVSDHDL